MVKDAEIFPFITLCYERHPDAIWLLVNASTDLNSQNEVGETLLHLACWNGNAAVVEFLLKTGAQLHLSNND